MTKITFIVLIATSLIYAETGGISSSQQEALQNLNIQQKELKVFVSKVNTYLDKYESYVTKYANTILSIKKQGATCMIAREKLAIAKSNYSEQIEMYEVMYKDCLKMKVNRKASLKKIQKNLHKIKREVDIMEGKLDLAEQKREMISNYISSRVNDYSLLNGTNRLLEQ